MSRTLAISKSEPQPNSKYSSLFDLKVRRVTFDQYLDRTEALICGGSLDFDTVFLATQINYLKVNLPYCVLNYSVNAF